MDAAVCRAEVCYPFGPKHGKASGSETPRVHIAYRHRGDRARRARSDHPDVARGLRALAHGLLRSCGALRPCAPPPGHVAGGMTAMDTILVVNAGSSSVKFQVFDADRGKELKRLIKGQMSGIGTRPRLKAEAADGSPLIDQSYPPGEVADVATALAVAGAWL